MIHINSTFQNQWKRCLTSRFMTGYTKIRERGFNNNICRFKFTVGCCENTIASNIIPAIPSRVRSVTSISQNVFCLLYSIIPASNITINTPLHNIVGVMVSHMLRLLTTLSALAFSKTAVDETSDLLFPALSIMAAPAKSLRRIVPPCGHHSIGESSYGRMMLHLD